MSGNCTIRIVSLATTYLSTQQLQLIIVNEQMNDGKTWKFSWYFNNFLFFLLSLFFLFKCIWIIRKILSICLLLLQVIIITIITLWKWLENLFQHEFTFFHSTKIFRKKFSFIHLTTSSVSSFLLPHLVT